MQVIITTHSPYLLDLLKLEHLVLVERNEEGHPTFFRPDSDKKLQQWADNFAPGKLYTMGSFSRSGR
jgi:predicted ATP-dependent endonuclease of OLD family